MALQTNARFLRDGIPVVQETTDMGTSTEPSDKAIVLQYLKDNKSNIFKELAVADGLTADQKTEYQALTTDEAKEQYLESVNVDTWIDQADTELYFNLLSDGYNSADFSIGTNLDYFMIEVTVKPSE